LRGGEVEERWRSTVDGAPRGLGGDASGEARFHRCLASASVSARSPTVDFFLLSAHDALKSPKLLRVDLCVGRQGGCSGSTWRPLLGNGIKAASSQFVVQESKGWPIPSAMQRRNRVSQGSHISRALSSTLSRDRAAANTGGGVARGSASQPGRRRTDRPARKAPPHAEKGTTTTDTDTKKAVWCLDIASTT
jgi:hypothetical protein